MNRTSTPLMVRSTPPYKSQHAATSMRASATQPRNQQLKLIIQNWCLVALSSYTQCFETLRITGNPNERHKLPRPGLSSRHRRERDARTTLRPQLQKAPLDRTLRQCGAGVPPAWGLQRHLRARDAYATLCPLPAQVTLRRCDVAMDATVRCCDAAMLRCN